MKQKKMTASLRHRRLILASGTFAMFFIGIIYAWSILKSPIASEFGWNISQLALNFTLTFCFFCIGGIIASFLTKKTSIKFTLLIAAFMVLAGFIMAARMSGKSVLALYLSYGLLCGLGIGMSYNAIVSSVYPWYQDKIGFCSGTLMMGFGISSLVFGKLASKLFEIPSIGWRTTYLAFGIAIFAVLVLSAFTISAPGSEDVLPEPKKRKGQIEEFETRDYSTKEMLRRPSFYMFFAFCMLITAVGNSVFSFARDYAISLGSQAALAATLVGLCSLSNGAGRIVCGIVYDIKGRRKTMLYANLLAIMGPLMAITSVLLHSLPLGIASLCCVGLSYGCAPTIIVAFVEKFYGRKDYAKNYSIAMANLIPASFAATIASTMIAKSNSYLGTFIMLTCCASIALVLNVNIKRP